MRRALSVLAIATFVPLALSAQGTIIPRPCLPNQLCPRPIQWAVVRTASHVQVRMDDRVLHYEVEEQFINRGGGV